MVGVRSATPRRKKSHNIRTGKSYPVRYDSPFKSIRSYKESLSPTRKSVSPVNPFSLGGGGPGDRKKTGKSAIDKSKRDVKNSESPVNLNLTDPLPAAALDKPALLKEVFAQLEGDSHGEVSVSDLKETVLVRDLPREFKEEVMTRLGECASQSISQADLLAQLSAPSVRTPD